MKKRISTLFLAVCMCLCVCFSFTGCLDSLYDDVEEDKSAVVLTSDPDADIDYISSRLGYSVTVNGTLKNVSNKQLSVTISFTCYDEEGYNVGTCTDVVNYLKPQESYKYSAFGTSKEKPANIKCSDLTWFFV